MTIEPFSSDDIQGVLNGVGSPFLTKLQSMIEEINGLRSDVAALQALIGSGAVRTTSEGGVAVRLVNKTGASSIKGTLIEPSDTAESAVELTEAESYDCIGVVYESGVADGELMWVVVYGIAEVLLKDGTAAAKGNWASTGDDSGRADCETTVPPGLILAHFREIGHCLEDKIAGTDVLCKISMHFN